MIVLLSREKSATVSQELASVGSVRVVRAPKPPQDDTAQSALWADRRLAEVDELVAAGGVVAFVCDSPAAAPFGWRVAEVHPTIPVLNGQAAAARVIGHLQESGTPVDTESVRETLDPLRRPWPQPPPWLVGRTGRPPLVVSIVNNAVDVDSRVQKVARSLADLGYDSVLLGRSPKTEPDGDWLMLGSALVLRAPVVTSRLHAQLSDPPSSRTDVLLGAPDPSRSGDPGRLAGRLQRLRQRRQDRAREMFATGTAVERLHRDQIRRIDSGQMSPAEAYPAVLDWAEVFVPELTALRPDIIHIHDPTLIPAAITARRLLRRSGHRVELVYDAHEWTLGIARDHVLQVPALARLESDHMADMAAVITVSEPIAGRMRHHFDLTATPAVVTNAPVARPVHPDEPDIRSDLALDADVPLLVYTGAVAEARGIDLALRALKRIPNAQLALVSRNVKPTRQALKRAKELGVGSRVHRLDYVAADDVPAYLRTADVGIIPFQVHLNSDLGIPTKFREYLLAGLPVVATDTGLTADEVRRTGVGEVADPESPRAFAAAISSVLADLDRYRSAITDDVRARNSWQDQERVLAEVYERVSPPPSSAAARGDLLIGGLNSAGQADAWARALTRSGVPARSLELRTAENPFEYRADIVIPRNSVDSLERRVQVMLRAVAPAGCVILESGQAIAAPEPGRPGGRRIGFREARALSAAGRNVGLIFHGSDLRRPDIHARTHPWSPFRDPAFRDVTEELRKRTRWNHEQLASWDGPVMVSTPDLVRQNPGAIWVPVVVDIDRFAGSARPPRQGPPVVLHLPSKSMMKGSHFIDPVLQDLADRGEIRYRRVTDVPHRQVPELLATSDIFVDQMGMGILGVAAVEAMAAGIPVVTDPGEEALTAYGVDVPVAVADPDSLADVVLDLARDPERRAGLSSAGTDFARRFHDGTVSAAAIISAMNLTGEE